MKVFRASAGSDSDLGTEGLLFSLSMELKHNTQPCGHCVGEAVN